MRGSLPVSPWLCRAPSPRQALGVQAGTLADGGEVVRRADDSVKLARKTGLPPWHGVLPGEMMRETRHRPPRFARWNLMFVGYVPDAELEPE